MNVAGVFHPFVSTIEPTRLNPISRSITTGGSVGRHVSVNEVFQDRHRTPN
jgi:hypothetical protein